MTPDDQAFFARHDAHPQGVYLVTVYPEQRTAVFKTKAAADAWLATLPDESTAVVAPFVIDEPDFGNVPPGRLA